MSRNRGLVQKGGGEKTDSAAENEMRINGNTKNRILNY